MPRLNLDIQKVLKLLDSGLRRKDDLLVEYLSAFVEVPF